MSELPHLSPIPHPTSPHLTLTSLKCGDGPVHGYRHIILEHSVVIEQRNNINVDVESRVVNMCLCIGTRLRAGDGEGGSSKGSGSEGNGEVGLQAHNIRTFCSHRMVRGWKEGTHKVKDKGILCEELRCSSAGSCQTCR